MSKTLYVSDLDGTLLNSNTEISLASRELLNQAISKGANFTIATARTPATVSGLLNGVAMSLPAIVMTGAAMWHPDRNIYTNIQTIAEPTVVAMKELYRKYKLPTFLYRLENNLIVLYHYGEMTALEQTFLDARIGNPFKRIELKSVGADGFPEENDNVVLFFGMQPNNKVYPVFDELQNIAVNPVMYHDMFGDEIAILEVFGSETSKANAVRCLAREIGANRIVAFGDNLNDLPLLKIADVAVAVDNAVAAVKLEADIVIGANDSDSVARFIAEDMLANPND